MWKLQTVPGFCPYNLQVQQVILAVLGGFPFTLLIDKGTLASAGHLSHHHSLQIFQCHLTSSAMNLIDRTYALNTHFLNPELLMQPLPLKQPKHCCHISSASVPSLPCLPLLEPLLCNLCLDRGSKVSLSPLELGKRYDWQQILEFIKFFT